MSAVEEAVMRHLFRTGPGQDPAPAGGDLGRLMVDEITWYMRENKVTRGELAQAMGVSPGRVSQILSGDENLTLRTLGSVIEALGARSDFSLRPIDEALA